MTKKNIKMKKKKKGEQKERYQEGTPEQFTIISSNGLGLHMASAGDHAL
jgi:hypothetical protein